MSTPETAPDVSPGSSPAPSAPPVSAQTVLDGMSETQRTQWQLTGDLPDQTIPAASSPATPAAPAASTDASSSPASEPGAPDRKGHKGNANTRVQELLGERAREREENARLRGQLEALQRGPATPDVRPGSSPATPPTHAEYKRYMAMPDAPQEADFENFAEFTAATSLFITDQRWQEHQTRSTREAAFERHVADVRQLGDTAAERVGKAIEADPEFRTKVDPELLAVDLASVRRLRGEKVGPEHVLAEQVAKSEAIDKLLPFFSTDDGKAEWRRLCALPPADLFRAFGRLEARFDSPGATTPAAPAPKTLSSAPPPPTTVGSRPTEPIDPGDAAIKRKDYLAYEAAENARALAGAR